MKQLKLTLTLGLLSIMCGSFLFFACQSENKVQEGTTSQVTIKTGFGEKNIEGAASYTLQVRDQRTTQVTEYSFEGKEEITLPLVYGSYSFLVTGTKGDVAISGNKDAVTISEPKTEIVITLNAHVEEANKYKGLIFSEIFNNGETNAHMMHPDQYFIIANNSDEVRYLDGLCWGIASHPNPLETTPELEHLKTKNELPLMTIIRFPGSGKEHPIQPGQEIVVADNAINHHNEETHPNSVDLSGADWEIVFPDKEGEGFSYHDVDNPDVPNVELVYSLFGGGMLMHPRGFFPPVIFYVKDNDMDKFLADHKLETTSPKVSKKMVSYCVPVEQIIDGVETGTNGQNIAKALPAVVDSDWAPLLTGCHRQELYVRKSEQKDGRKHWIDTNNSSNDFEKVKGQHSFPKK